MLNFASGGASSKNSNSSSKKSNNISGISRDSSGVFRPDETTLIYQKPLDGTDVGTLNLKDSQSLVKELELAKAELKRLKTDHFVLAKNRTVKRLLDHVKIEGTQNMSFNVKADLEQQVNQFEH